MQAALRSTGASVAEENKERQAQFITDLNENDVLCGRGSGPNDHAGNIKFRKLVLSRKAEYLSTRARCTKARIAREIVDHIQSRDPPGRFLKKLDADSPKDAGFTDGADAWCVVAEGVALEKAKQALRQNRDRHLVEAELWKHRRIRSDTSEETVATAGSGQVEVPHDAEETSTFFNGGGDDSVAHGSAVPRPHPDTPESSGDPCRVERKYSSCRFRRIATDIAADSALMGPTPPQPPQGDRRLHPVESEPSMFSGIERDFQRMGAECDHQRSTVQRHIHDGLHQQWQHEDGQGSFQEQFPFAFGVQGSNNSAAIGGPLPAHETVSGFGSNREMDEQPHFSGQTLEFAHPAFVQGSYQLSPQEQYQRQRRYGDEDCSIPASDRPTSSRSSSFRAIGFCSGGNRCRSSSNMSTASTSGMPDISMSMSLTDI